MSEPQAPHSAQLRPRDRCTRLALALRCSRLRAVATPLLLVLAFASGCAQCAGRVDVYRTRGEVRALERDGEEIRVAIHHEAIPTFRDREGEPAPMASMPMLFALGAGVSSAGLAPAAKLAFTFEVRWDERPTLVITALTRLPAHTALALSDEH